MTRMRRLRANKIIRDSLSQTSIRKEQLIYPVFVTAGIGIRKDISTLQGQKLFSPDTLQKEMERFLELGLDKFLLFGEAENKDHIGSEAWDPKSVVPTTVRILKETYGDKIHLITDVCLCPYTSHGHCGIPDKKTQKIDNDKSTSLISKAAVTYAEAGSDWVAPSDMMDFRVRDIRRELDARGLYDTGILSYSVKFASSYYGPFRGAIDSSPRFGDRKTYQMDYRDIRQVSREIQQDTEEGADALMVKPALAYLDVIRKVREETNLPLAVYNVSGEYAMVKSAAEAGLIDEKGVVLENLSAMVRAGADWIITYHARDMLERNWI